MSATAAKPRSKPSWANELLYLARRYPLGVAGAIIMTVFVLAALFAGVVAPLDPFSTNPALGATFLGSGFGAALGLASGYVGGWFDLVVQRLGEIMQALPLLVMALVITASLGPSLPNTIIAIAIPLIPNVARVIRANVLSLRELPFVEAAKATGMSELRVAVVHVLPNTLAPLIVLATAQLGSTILTEASLSFLGLGVPEPYPSWGRMLSESAAEYVRTAPWLVIFPGLAISAVVFGANLLGDALRDALDPRQRD
ncbi:MAG: ABC transporter permease [Rhodospirillales bacterium]|nr:ABC transporter permease [Rhodospirillales bacterium]